MLHAQLDQAALRGMQVLVHCCTVGGSGASLYSAAMSADAPTFRIDRRHRPAPGRPRLPAGPGRGHDASAACAGCALAVLADGMGGKSGGRKAADQVIMTARQIFERFVPHKDSAADMLRQMVQESHLMIKLTAITAEEEPHSTVAAFLLTPDLRCDAIHAGDSRVYHFRGAELVARTIDHSFVQRLIDEGKITEEAANTHPQSNLLTGCLGTHQDPPLAIWNVGTARSTATPCWPAATACGTTSRRRRSAPSCRRCRRARRPRCWSPRRASARAAAATTCRWRWCGSTPLA